MKVYRADLGGVIEEREATKETERFFFFYYPAAHKDFREDKASEYHAYFHTFEEAVAWTRETFAKRIKAANEALDSERERLLRFEMTYGEDARRAKECV